MALRFGVPCAMMLGLLLATAGSVTVWPFYAWVGVLWSIASAMYSVLGRVNPELLAERLRPPSDRDRATRRLVALPFLALLVVSGLDARFGWSRVTPGLVLAALVMVALGLALVGWVLFTNPFASSAVRVQPERGQRVVTSGPYALVRHPMYLAVVLVVVASGPALGSFYAMLTMLPVLAIFLRRTLVEDHMLRDELDGYAAYAARVRWRVIPFLF